MAYILHIDTAMDQASVCLAKDEEMVALAVNEKQKDHAGWLQSAIEKQLSGAGVDFRELGAVAVSIGPGSYTGLRIGLSSAKGLCYALDIPLIAIGTLDMMAENAIAQNAGKGSALICPMIDARRMEVYTAVYTSASARVAEPGAMILDENSFSDLLNDHTMLFFGNGSRKFQTITHNKNAVFAPIAVNATGLIKISNKRFLIKDFNSLPYTEPAYIKEFHSCVK